MAASSGSSHFIAFKLNYQFRCNYFKKENQISAVNPTGAFSSLVFQVRSTLRLGVAGGNPMTEFLEEMDWLEMRNSHMELPWSVDDGLMTDDVDNYLKICETLTGLRVPNSYHRSIINRIHLQAPAGLRIAGAAPNMVASIFEVTHITLPLVDDQGKAIYPEDGDYTFIRYPFQTEYEGYAKFVDHLREFVGVTEDTSKEDEDASIDNWWRKLIDALERVAWPVTKEAEVGDRDERTCPICIDDVLEADKACSKMPCCRQVFHCDCISKWTKRVKKCPWCRSPLPLVVQSAKGFAQMTKFRAFLPSKVAPAS